MNLQVVLHRGDWDGKTIGGAGAYPESIEVLGLDGYTPITYRRSEYFHDGHRVYTADES